MGKFIQYEIKNIFEVIDGLISNFNTQNLYTDSEIKEIYRKFRSYETPKSQNGSIRILKDTVFKKDNKTKKYRFTPEGKLILKHNEDSKIIKELLYSYQYDYSEIFKLECDILFNYLEEMGEIYQDRDMLHKIIIKKLSKFLIGEQEKDLKNAKGKISRTSINLEQSGIAIFEENNIFHLRYYEPEWRVVLLMFTQEFMTHKVTFQALENSNTRKKFFISEIKLRDYFNKFEDENLISIEDEAGLQQLDFLYNDPDKLVEKL